jgi:nicotinamide mononucleotide transporter
MGWSEFLNLFYRNLVESTFIEAIAVIFGLLSVWYAKKENLLVYPTGIVSVLIYVYICFFAGLYADMGINFFYFLMSVFGWYKWTRKDKTDHHIPISRCSLLMHFSGIFATVFFFLILRYLLINHTDSTVPNVDAATTAVFIVGMWLMALKKIENWIYWIIGDIISIPLYFSKGLVLTSFQYTVFLILAILGYLEWRNKINEAKQNF